MLVKKDIDPYPLFISIFDLELLTYYLSDPYDLMYYVRQRVGLAEYYISDEEINYLGYHLERKLYRTNDYDRVMIDSSFGLRIDRNYYPYKTGLTHLLSERNDPIHNRWNNLKFEEFLTAIKSSKFSKVSDIVFQFLDLSFDSRDKIVEQIFMCKEKSRLNCKSKSMSAGFQFNFGMSYLAAGPENLSSLDFNVRIYSELKKYKLKCNTWLGIGAFWNSPNLIDYMIYLDNPWEFNLQLEEDSAELFNSSNSRKIISIEGGLRIGRNDRCPCNSGLKYKKCCGK
ncbi:SEC-C metal-binding domain-containing protein [Emticicia sp. 21SJ11W-3]|uniref:SEC-C metal-binding domain-containing protein n=1 Tax=Emticicia sp. 21SJ11W-3 TaxID=2916755 RepID=UPI00209E11F8|nr:SEC-C metal-binding domain-containing protein [Emticicia sp. 21SJ11W-3]UTA66485.1 SEC-C domain-containing protein [Emticicia sp. 21SJ11W-3]